MELERALARYAEKLLSGELFRVPVGRVEDTKATVLRAREILDDKWRPGKRRVKGHSQLPKEETVKRLAELLRDVKGDIVFLGPFVGRWREAIERAAGKPVISIDASRAYLRQHRDPYKDMGVWRRKRDLWDEFLRGVGLTLLHPDSTIVHYEFSPCIVAPTLCLLLSLSAARHYIHITGETFSTKLEDMLSELPFIRYRVVHLPTDPGITGGRVAKAYVFRRDENPAVAAAGRIIRSIHTATHYTLPDVKELIRRELEALPEEERERAKRVLLRLFREVGIVKERL